MSKRDAMRDAALTGIRPHCHSNLIFTPMFARFSSALIISSSDIHRGRRTAGPDLGGRWSSRLVATASVNTPELN